MIINKQKGANVMYLHVAVKKAKESGKGFTRQSYITKRESAKESDNTVWFYPTNSIVSIWFRWTKKTCPKY